MATPSLFDRDAAVLIVGDVMLDGYASGGVERISPEAPVPVLKHLTHHEVPGGGANVAMNIAALGGKPCLIGLVGEDEEGRRLGAMLETAGVALRLVPVAGRPTTFKLRILAGNHQMLRIDKEVVADPPPPAEQALIRAVGEALPGMRAVVVSDYRKGCLTDRVLAAIIAQARALDIPVIVDPKRHDFSGYAGASFLTPNRAELKAATGIACETDEACREAAALAGAATGAGILLTRSEQGMSLYPVEGEEILLPTEAQEVFDVSGAGDSVVAAFAYSVASGHPVAQAMRLANCVAGLVVAKAGTAIVSEAELVAALDRAHPAAGVSEGDTGWEDAIAVRAAWGRQELRVGFTNGCFDLVHPGHVALLREAARQCDRLIVGLNDDASIARLKGPTRPVQTAAARAEVLSAIRHVDLVVIFSDDTPLALIEALEPDLLVKGSDYTEDAIVGAPFVKARGGTVYRVDLREGHSTSSIIARSKTPPNG